MISRRNFLYTVAAGATATAAPHLLAHCCAQRLVGAGTWPCAGVNGDSGYIVAQQNLTSVAKSV